jgi:putative sigma-54 modulation protein
MEIFVRGKNNFKVTKAIESYVEEKLNKLDTYLGDSENVKANVLISVHDRAQKVEVTIPLKNFILRAEDVQEDLYASIDTVADKLQRQIRKNKTRLASKKMKTVAIQDFVFDKIEDVEEDEEKEEKIVKRKKVEVKPMSEEEAILQMELLGNQFYIFKDAETMKPTLVYKRKEGNYGVIETE